MAHVAIMIRIIPSENRNMYFRMIQDSDTTFKVEMGRVGAAPYIRYYPISVWDKMYQKKISEGYQDKTERRHSLLVSWVQKYELPVHFT